VDRVLPGRLAAAGVPDSLAAPVAEQVGRVAQGTVPVPAGTPPDLAGAVVAAGHAAFADGLRVAMSVALVIALVCVALAVLIRPADGQPIDGGDTDTL
jgi:hypothetical protein